MAKGGTLANIGQALAGYGSALSGNPMFLQNALLMRQAQEQQRQQEQAQRQEQVAGIAARAYATGGSAMNDANKRGMLRMMAPQAFQSMMAQRAMSELYPQGFTGTLGEGDVAFQNGREVARGAAKAQEPVRGVQMANRLVNPVTGETIREFPAEQPVAQKPFGYDEDQKRKAAEDARKKRADEYAFAIADEGFLDIMRSAARLGTNRNLEKYTGVLDGNTPYVSEDAKQFLSDLDVLKSNLAMNALNAARAGSATGATGFGALSEGELKILQNQIATLDPAVGKTNFQRQIVDIINKTKKIRSALRSGRDAASSGFKIELMGE